MGMHGCSTAPVAFNDCEVPAENLLGPEGMGYVQALKTLTAGRVTVSARCVGMMDKLIGRCVEYMKVRTQGGHKLAEYTRACSGCSPTWRCSATPRAV